MPSIIEVLGQQIGSSYAGQIDGLILLIFVLTGFWFVIAELTFFGLMWRFRDRGQRAKYVTGEEHEYTRFIHWPHYLIIICDLFIIVFAVRTWYNVKQHLPEADETVRVEVQQWAWTFTHAGPDGKLDTEDDIRTVDELHVEVGKTYHYELTSRDVLHNFSVPVFRLKQDAIPGRTIKGWFEPTVPGEFDIQCAEMCGIGHGIMNAFLYVETPEEHASWLSEHTSSFAEAGKE